MAYSCMAVTFVVVLDPDPYMLVMVTWVLSANSNLFAKIVPVFIMRLVAAARCKNALGKSRLP